MTDQISFLPMLDDAEHPTWLLSGKPGMQNDCGVYTGDEVDAVLAEKDKEIEGLKRALWLARAKRALEKIAWFKLWNASISTMNPEDGARQEFDKWKKNLGKFLKKAEEYK